MQRGGTAWDICMEPDYPIVCGDATALRSSKKRLLDLFLFPDTLDPIKQMASRGHVAVSARGGVCAQARSSANMSLILQPFTNLDWSMSHNHVN